MSARKLPDIQLSTYSSLLGQDEGKRIVFLPLEELHAHKRHPFRVVDNEDMDELAASIQANGVLEPVAVRTDPAGGYELISGHRRCHAAQRVGLENIPAHIEEMEDAQADIAMVDANLRRSNILPSEKAWAYRIKKEAENRQGFRSDLHSSRPVVTKLPESERTIQRYVRLTYLSEDLLALVDEGKLPLRHGAMVSYFSTEDQALFLNHLQGTGGKVPSLEALTELKRKLDAHEKITAQIPLLFQPKRKAVREKISIPQSSISQWLPADFTQEQTQELIVRLVREWAGE